MIQVCKPLAVSKQKRPPSSGLHNQYIRIDRKSEEVGDAFSPTNDQSDFQQKPASCLAFALRRQRRFRKTAVRS
jgi:hypothetical protein